MITIEITRDGYTGKLDIPTCFTTKQVGELVAHYLELYDICTAPITKKAVPLEEIKAMYAVDMHNGSKTERVIAPDRLTPAFQATMDGISDTTREIYNEIKEQVKPITSSTPLTKINE